MAQHAPRWEGLVLTRIVVATCFFALAAVTITWLSTREIAPTLSAFIFSTIAGLFFGADADEKWTTLEKTFPDEN